MMIEVIVELIRILMCYLTGMVFGVGAVVFSQSLTRNGEIFGWWPVLLTRITDNEAVHKAAYGCPKCVAGQFAFWVSLFVYGNIYLTLLTVIVAVYSAWHITEKNG